MFHISKKTVDLLKRYESEILFSNISNYKKRNILYEIVKPILNFHKEYIIKKYNIEINEAKSEIFLLCCQIYKKFNPSRSSFLPYVLKNMKLFILEHIKKLDKKLKEYKLINIEDDIEIDEEFYYYGTNILFLDKYIGKIFTKGEKYLIYRILISDDIINKREFAKELGISKNYLYNKLSDIKSVMEEFYGI